MALFIPVIIGAPIGYFTWSKVFETVDNSVYQLTRSKNSNEDTLNKPANSKSLATVSTIVTAVILSKLTFTPQVRHRLFFEKAPPNTNIRIQTLKMGIELLTRCGIVFYGGATGGAIGGRIASII